MEDKNISTAPEIPGKLQEFCHFLQGRGKLLENSYFPCTPGILLEFYGE